MFYRCTQTLRKAGTVSVLLSRDDLTDTLTASPQNGARALIENDAEYELHACYVEARPVAPRTPKVYDLHYRIHGCRVVVDVYRSDELMASCRRYLYEQRSHANLRVSIKKPYQVAECDERTSNSIYLCMSLVT